MSEPAGKRAKAKAAPSKPDELDEGWGIARKYADLLGSMPSIFTTAIRALKRLEALGNVPKQEADNQIMEACSFLINVSPSLKSVFYHAALDLHPEVLEKELNVKNLLLAFTPCEIANILAITYLYRRVRKKCDPKEWTILTGKLHAHMEIGGIIGETINHIGTGNGVLIGAMRYISLVMFSFKDLKKYQEYRRRTADGDSLFDLAEETRRWGCNHMQVASILVQNAGLGLVPSMGLGIESIPPGARALGPDVEEQLLCWHATIVWTEAFHRTGAPPTTQSEEDVMFLPEDEAVEMKRRIWSIIRDGSTFDWIAKSKADLPEDVAEALDVKPIKAATPEDDDEFEEEESSSDQLA